MYIRYLYLFFLIPAFCLIFSGCDKNEARQPFVSSSIHQVDDRHPSESDIRADYARGFSLENRAGFKVLRVFNAQQGRTDTLRYVLLEAGEEIPPGFADAQVLRVPVNRVVVTSATHVGMIDALGENPTIAGVTDPRYLYNPKLKQRIEQGEVTVLSGGNLSMEKILALDPDLLMVSGGQVAQFEEYQLLIESGIQVVVNSEWLENTPLARAEWIKVMGLLYQKEDKAKKIFRETESRYRELTRLAEKAEPKPLVINNLPYKGAWFVSGGNSYVAEFLRDAGASYPWLDTESMGSLKLDFEAAYEKGLEADVWIMPGTATNKKEILRKDERLGDFKAFKTGRIFNNTRKTNSEGGNDYWESGVVNPHLILADLISILHPDLLPDHRLYYYEKVE